MRSITEMRYLQRLIPNCLKNASLYRNSVIVKNWCILKVPLRHSFVTAPRKIVRLRRYHSVSAVAMSVGQKQGTFYSDSPISCNCSNYQKVSTVLDQTTTRKMPEVKPFQRLPDNVKPKHYKLSLVPDLKSFIFRGDVSIQIEVGLPFPYAAIYHRNSYIFSINRCFCGQLSYGFLF